MEQPPIPQRLREKVVHALRAAADALEAGEDKTKRLVWMHDAPDESYEEHDSAVDAEFNAERAIAPDDDEYHPDIGGTSWGVYVKVQWADVEVMERNEHGDTPREAGFDFDEWWEVTLEDAWEEKP